MQLFTPQLSTTYPQKNGELEKEPPRLEAVGAIADAVADNRLEQLPDDIAQLCGGGSQQRQREGIQGLQRAFETQGARMALMLGGRLRHDLADEVVDEQMGP